MKKTFCTILAFLLLAASFTACDNNKHDSDLTDVQSQSEIEESLENIDTTGSNFEETDEKTTESEANVENVDKLPGEFDPATSMMYTLNDDGKSYSACPAGLPDVIKELVFPVEYKGLPVTEIHAYKMIEISIETIIIPEGIKVVTGSFDKCFNIKNIYIPASVVYIGCTFHSRPTMGYPSFIKSNVIEKIVVAEGNPYYYVDGNCLIDRRSKKIILGCNSSVIPIDGSVKRIGEAAFANCKSIETIILPKSIIEIEIYAFVNCPNLKQVYITSSVSEDKKIINFDAEFTFEDGSQHIFYVPDAESLEIYSKIFGSYHAKFEIGTP